MSFELFIPSCLINICMTFMWWFLAMIILLWILLWVLQWVLRWVLQWILIFSHPPSLCCLTTIWWFVAIPLTALSGSRVTAVASRVLDWPSLILWVWLPCLLETVPQFLVSYRVIVTYLLGFITSWDLCDLIYLVSLISSIWPHLSDLVYLTSSIWSCLFVLMNSRSFLSCSSFCSLDFIAFSGPATRCWRRITESTGVISYSQHLRYDHRARSRRKR